ncbi:MAG: 30S ribosomal protein S17 [Phycisphaerales bacterium]
MSHTKSIQVSDTAPRRVGVVESDSRDKTRKVMINFLVKHPKYGKYVRKRTVLHVHDEDNQSKIGDRVEIAECRPLSKTKMWTITRIVEAGPGLIEGHKTTVAGADGEIGAEVEQADDAEEVPS